jgi:ribosome maturation factor RimP
VASTTEAQVAAVRAAVEPAVAALDLDLYDVELVGGGDARTLRVTVTKPGGIDLDSITAATQAVSPIVDTTDAVNGSYLLEVSSPGIERALRTDAHFRGALGEQVTVKFHTEGGPRRVQGVLADADADTCVVDTHDGREVIVRRDITQARTVFDWGPQPRPGKGKSAKGSKTQARAKESR